MIEQARNICIELLRRIPRPSGADINNAIENVSKIFPLLSTEREILEKYLTASFSVFSEDYKILDVDNGYEPWLKDAKGSIKWNFWNRYTSYLQKKLAPDTINKLDNLTDDILDRIGNPFLTGAWDKRGMVVGQVQSGKTGNYTGLINKAADAGYKLIIVLAGMHDSLRSQTQIRIDEGFLGFNSKHSLRYSTSNKIGVGLYNPINDRTNSPLDLPANSLTSSNLDGDFRGPVAQSNRIHLKGSDPIVAVVKKNGAILRNLITWLAAWGEKQNDGKIVIRDLPFLLIDDEADNASINVSEKKVSAINGCIRALLSLFEKSSYVGYTATPFANVFIKILDEEATKGLDLTVKDYEFTVGQDLFPKDFIINIPAPSNYIGPSRIFGLPAFSSSEIDEEPLPLIRSVTDYEVFDASNAQEDKQNIRLGLSQKAKDAKTSKTFIPDKHKKSDPLPETLPASLIYAVKCFILSAAARRVRKQIEVHNSMLIHVSRYIVWQDRIATLVDAELKSCQRQIDLKSGSLIKELRTIWEKEFEPTTAQILRDKHIYTDPEITAITWAEIEPEIYPAVSKMEVRAVHGDKNISGLSHHNISPLDYFFSEEQGKYLSVIAVGGDKLSRGLTLEGLSVSYYLRASKMYDTLMQMGRWFGYRPGYADLCRIFTSDELIKWYKHITIASEDMRQDFDYMFLLKRTPKDFGLKVRTHSGVLKITAANKFRYKKIMQLSYSGELAQTYQFRIKATDFKDNLKALNRLIASLGDPTPNNWNSKNPKQKFIWKGSNNVDSVLTFLSNYTIERAVVDVSKVVDYIAAQNKNGNLINWTVAVLNNTQSELPDQFSLLEGFEKIGLTKRSNVSTGSSIYEIRNFNITDHVHELIDLDEAMIKRAQEQTNADYDLEDESKKEKRTYPDKPSRKRVKWVRDDKSALLLIYPLNPKEIAKIDPSVTTPIIGIAVSFPEIENDEKIEYAVNEQFESELDYPEEFDQSESADGED